MMALQVSRAHSGMLELLHRLLDDCTCCRSSQGFQEVHLEVPRFVCRVLTQPGLGCRAMWRLPPRGGGPWGMDDNVTMTCVALVSVQESSPAVLA